MLKEDLQKGKKVLFTGTACQIAAIKGFLSKDYEKLITCDVVCHGVLYDFPLRKREQDLLFGRRCAGRFRRLVAPRRNSPRMADVRRSDGDRFPRGDRCRACGDRPFLSENAEKSRRRINNNRKTRGIL